MPKAEKGTPKWIANQWKKKGLNKLRWYCGLCGVSCMDANGFKLHMAHENHLRRETEAGQQQQSRDGEARYHADAFSEQFERNYLRYLATQRIGQRVSALDAYRVLHPDDRQQKDMERTCWRTLGRFICDLRERGEVFAERGDHGWFVTVFDDAPAAAWATLPDAEAKAMRGTDTARSAPRAWNEARTEYDSDDEKLLKKRRKLNEKEGAFAMAERVAAERQERQAAEETTVALAPPPPEALIGKVRAFKMKAAAPKVLGAPLSTAATTTTTTLATVADNVPSTKKSWLRANLVVKVIKGSGLGAAFDKKKCLIIRLEEEGALVETPVRRLVETPEGAQRSVVRAEQLETVIPAIGKPVRIVAGEHAGRVATLVELRLGDFCAKLQLENEKRVLETNFPYETFCRDIGLE